MIGESYKQAYPKLFKGYYDPDEYSFRHTNTPRTIDSFHGFINGIFGKFSNEYVLSTINETLLRPHEYCPNHLKIVGNMYNKNSEPWRFLIDYTNIIEEVSIRLGFDHPLPVTQIEDMYSLCNYETAYNNYVPSAWCAAFTMKHVEWFEYHWDILDYIGSGFRNKINRKLMGPAIVDMINSLEYDDGPIVTANFGHSYSMKIFLTSMGIGENPIPLRADNFDQMANRTFRVSELTPFGSNLAAVKYDCNHADDKVLFFLNEKPAQFDYCKSGVCEMSELKKRYHRFLEENNEEAFKEICFSNANTFMRISITNLIITFILVKFIY